MGKVLLQLQLASITCWCCLSKSDTDRKTHTNFHIDIDPFNKIDKFLVDRHKFCKALRSQRRSYSARVVVRNHIIADKSCSVFEKKTALLKGSAELHDEQTVAELQLRQGDVQPMQELLLLSK